MHAFRLLALSAFALSTTVAASAQTVLTVSSWVPPQHHITLNIKSWCDDVEKGTAGRVKCTLLAKPVAPPTGALNSVRRGLADVSFTVAAYNSEPLPLSMLFSVPFAAGPQADASIVSVASWRIYQHHLAKYQEYRGVKLLTLGAASPIQIFTTGKPIKSINDLKGLKLMVGSKTAADLVESVGALPVVKPASQMYEMFSGGIVDGSFNPIESVKSFKAAPFVKSVAYVPGGVNFGTIAVYMSQSRWDALNKEDQAVLEGAAGERLARRLGAGFDREDQEALALLRSSGAAVEQATPELLSGLAERAQPVRQALTAAAKERGADNAEAVLSELRAEVDRLAKEAHR